MGVVLIDIALDGNCPGENCPGGYCLRWDMLEGNRPGVSYICWHLSYVGVVLVLVDQLVVVWLDPSSSGWNCPGWDFAGWEVSR